MDIHQESIAQFDWSNSALGPRRNWPVSLNAIFDIVSASPVAMCATWGHDDTLLYNAAYAPFLANRHPAALGQPIAEVWADVWDTIGPLIARVKLGESVSFTDMLLVMHRKGYAEDTWWSFSYSPLYDQGSITGFIDVATETTASVLAARDRDAAEAETRARNKALEVEVAARQDAMRMAEANSERVKLAHAAGAIIGTWVWDIRNDRFTIDEAFATTFDIDPQLGSQNISLARVVETVHPDDKAGLADAIQHAVDNCGTYRHQYRVRRADGIFYWIEANGKVECNEHGEAYRFPGVLLDLTERRQIESERDRVSDELKILNASLEDRVAERTRELAETMATLRQSQKMEAVGQLTGGLAHDFNNLLAGISGALDVMQLRMLNGQFRDFERYIVSAQSGVKRAAALTHRLLAFSRRQTLDPRPADVNRLVLEMHELIERSGRSNISVQVLRDEHLWPALVDASQLENALLNLCINARDAMPEGGRIVIETKNEFFDNVAARKLDVAAGDYLALHISDTGAGIAPDILEKVFDPFFTTKPTGEGTGLGLSMVYGFAKQSGGHIQIQSELGRGTKVSIYLPRYHEKTVGEVVDTPVKPVVIASRRPTVLVVEDEQMIRMLILDALADMGYAWLEAGDSATGLKILQSDMPVDLLVSDVGLPGGLNGRQMADAGRQIRPELPIMFITGHAETAAAGNVQLPKGMQVMTKPFDLLALMDRMRAMVEGRLR